MNFKQFNELIQEIIDNWDHNKCFRWCMKKQETTHISNFFYMKEKENPQAFNNRFDCLNCKYFVMGEKAGDNAICDPI